MIHQILQQKASQSAATHPAINYLPKLFLPDDSVLFALQTPGKEGLEQYLTTKDDSFSEETLRWLNEENAEGKNIYVCMSAIKRREDGSIHRTKNDLAAIRAVYIDIDESGVANLDALLEDAFQENIPEPHFVITSSPNKFQIIWLVEDLDPTTQEALNKALQQKYHADPASTDCVRILRMPGFKNCKPEYDPKPLVTIQENYSGPRYKLEDFKIDLTAAKANIVKAPPTVTGEIIPYGQHDNELHRIAGRLRHDGLEEEAIYNALIEVVEKRCENPGSDFRDMCRKHAHNICMKPIGKIAEVYNSGYAKSAVQTAVPARWPEPRRFESSTVEALPFKLEYLPVAIRDWAEDLAERMSVPLDFTGIASLVTLAGCMNRRVFVHPLTNDQSWREPVSISGAVIASSGRKKTPVWRQFTNPLVEIELKWAEAHQQCVQTYKKAHAEWEEKQKQAKAAKKPFDEPEPQEPSPKQRLIMNGATPEALHNTMSTNPRGVFIYRDELAGWVAELEKQGYESQKEVFLCGMNGDDSYSMDRIGRGTVTARMSASMFGGIQPELFFEFLNSKGGSNVACGLIPRFGLLVYPNTPVLPLLDRAENTIAKSIFKGLLRSLASMGVESLTLRFDKEAQVRFNEWRRSWQLKVDAEKSEAKQSHLNKYVGLVPRLAGLAQVVDQLAPRLRESGDAMLGGFYHIDRDHLNQVLGFIEYLESHLNKIYSHVKSEGRKAEEALSTHLLTGDLKDGFTVREITNRKQWAFLKDARTVEYALGSFEELGWVRQLPSGFGRPTLKWEINPKLAANTFDSALK